MSFDERELIEYVTSRRWYGAKSRTVAHSQLLDSVILRAAEPQFALALVEMRYETGAHDIYQLVYALRGDRLEVDALDDPVAARELVHAMRSGLTLQGVEGSVEFRPVAGFTGLGRELMDARSVGAEQSNSSIVFDDELILKVFRRLEPGINPELEMLRFLTEHEFANIAALGGWYAYSGGPLGATLGILQEFVLDGLDGWGLALDEICTSPEDFGERLHRLGEVTGEMHTVLASDANDPAFAPETPSVEALALLTATVDEEIERVFLTLPEDDERVAPIAGRGEEVREQLRMLTHAGSAGKAIRTHGDYHLGQTLWSGPRLEAPSAEPTAPGRGSGAPAAPRLEAPSAEPTAPGRGSGAPAALQGDWVILDFEGEPARSLTDRRRKRSPLRDVAGMLRSFAYVASAVELLRGRRAPDGWEESARAQFLEGYLATVDPVLLPSGQVGIERMLAVYELEKAVYELQYELDNRPDWVGIPVAGIQRLIETAAAA